jgi:hypothetical protein
LIRRDLQSNTWAAKGTRFLARILGFAARLNEAIAQGCDMATASTLPGGVSQRNYERAGVEVVYTKVTLVA